MTDAEAAALGDCLRPELQAAYARSGNTVAAGYAGYTQYSTQAYISATHGGRLVENYGNAVAKAYGKYENAGTMPVGSKLAKPSFSVKGDGKGVLGPLFIMEKMQGGFNAESDDWRYTMVMPNGAVAGTTNGKGSKNVQFCIGCHQSVTPEQDNIMLLPEEYRK